MPRLIAISSLALLLIFGCLQGALWQYERYEVRHENNELIRKNVAITTPLSEDELGSKIHQRLPGAISHLMETLILVKNSLFEIAITRVSMVLV